MRALLFPAAFRRFPGNLRAALWRQVLGALLSALRAERFRSGVFAVINDGVGALASGGSRGLTDFRYRYAKLAFCRFRVGEGRREQNAIGSTIGVAAPLIGGGLADPIEGARAEAPAVRAGRRAMDG